MAFGTVASTPRVTTGNVRTTVDAVTSTGYMPNPTFNQFGLQNPLGTIWTDVGGPDSVSGTITQLPAFQSAIYKYVLYKSTGNPALVAQPAIVYYTDNTSTVVSGAAADAFPTPASGIAGILMPNTTDLPNLTATILNNGALGSGVWICIGGFVKGAAAPAATAAGDILVGVAGNFLLARSTAFAAATVAAIRALTALAGASADMFIFGLPEEI